MLTLTDNHFDRIERWLLYLLIVTIPIDNLPKHYHLFGFMRNVPFTILCLAIIIALFRYIYYEGEYGKPPLKVKTLVVISIIWPILCTIIGVLDFPYWDDSANEFLRSTDFVQKLAHFIPGILQNDDLLHLKYANSLVISTLKGLLLPLIGIPFYVYVSFRNKPFSYTINVVSKASTFAACAFSLYSLVEIPWVLTGNEFCAGILKFINVHLYDVATDHGWWPPILWTGPQLRSFTHEPSFFCIEAVFILPLLWYRVFELKEKKAIVLLLLFTYMLYLTKARTGQVIFLGELFLLIILSIWGRYKNWKKYLLGTLIISALSFFIFLAAPMVISHISSNTITDNVTIHRALDSYVSNDLASAGSLNKRSNVARWGDTIALFKVGMEHPLFGVGTNLHSSYMVNNIPEFARQDGEINLWVSLMEKEGFLKSGFPVMNEYAGILAMYGFPGLLLFIGPIFWIAYNIWTHRQMWLKNYGFICLLISLVGQMVCLFANTLFYTYPLALGFIILFILTSRKSRILKKQKLK